MKMPSLSADHEQLIAALSPALRSLALRGAVRSYRKNSVIINEGELGESLFVLLQGRVKVYSNDGDGREITYNFVEQGDYFAEMWLDGGPRSASVMTLEPSICSIVGRTALRQHLADAPLHGGESRAADVGRRTEGELIERKVADADVRHRRLRRRPPIR